MTTRIDDPPRATSALTRRAPLLACLWSVAAIGLGLFWLLDDTSYPFASDVEAASLSLLGGIGARAGASLLTLLAACGVTLSLLARLRPTHSRPLVAGSATLAVVFGVLVPDIQLLIVMAYLTALSLPIAAVVGLILCLRSPRWSAVAAVVAAAAGTWAWQTGAVDPDALRTLGDGLLEGFANLGLRPFFLLFFLAGGAIWATAATSAYHRSGRLAQARWARPDAAARWGRVATLVAAACAVPYGLLRMTWLTPWPVGIDPTELASSPALRVFGVMLGGAALSGGVLTLGLISRWGEAWPRWIPGLHGGPVPVLAAVAPGATIATLFTMSGLPVAKTMIEQEAYAYLLVFPFVVWGPALGAATLAYYLRRRPVTRVAVRDERR